MYSTENCPDENGAGDHSAVTNVKHAELNIDKSIKC